MRGSGLKEQHTWKVMNWRGEGGGRFGELGGLLTDKALSVNNGTGEARSGEFYIPMATGSFQTQKRS